MIRINGHKLACFRKIVSIFLAVVFVWSQFSMNAAHAKRMIHEVQITAHSNVAHDMAIHSEPQSVAAAAHDHVSMSHLSMGHVSEDGGAAPINQAAQGDCSGPCCIAGCGIFAANNTSLLYPPRHVAAIELLPEISRSGFDRVPPNRPPRY